MKKYFIHIVANFLLAVTVLCVAFVGLAGTTINVFRGVDNSPIYRGENENAVSLMINVYWGTEYLQGILDILKKYDVHCTFFVGGYWVSQNFETVKLISSEGHELGNHGYFHKQHSKLTYKQNVDEMVTCSKLVFDCCGVYPTLFAPPSGDFSEETLQAAKDNGFETIMWSRDTIDWRDKDSDLIYSRATKDAKGGELILMHPTLHTLRALEKIVQYYLGRNIKIITVGEMLGG